MRSRSSHAWTAAVLGLAAALLLVVPTIVQSPSLLTWLAEQDGVFRGGGVGVAGGGQLLTLKDGSPTVVQEVRGDGYEVDAVALHLPTRNDTIEGTLRVAVSPRVVGDSATPQPVITSRPVNLSLVKDWGMVVFRLPKSDPPLAAQAYDIEVVSEGEAMLVVSTGDPYPGALLLDGQKTEKDLAMRVYRRASWPAFLKALERSSETKAPAWIAGLAMLMVPALLGLSVYGVVSPEGLFGTAR